MLREETKYRLVSNDGEIPFENYMKIDNTNLDPSEVALMIKERFNLQGISVTELMNRVKLEGVREDEIEQLYDMQIKSFMSLYEKYHDEGSPAIESIERVRDRALQAETEKIAADGTQLKGQIAELQEMEQKSQSTFEQFKAEDIERYQSEIGALNQEREQLQAAAAQQNTRRQQTLEQLRRRIQNMTASIECGTLSPADGEHLAECKASLEDCRVQLAAAQQVLSAAPENFDTRIKAIEEEITEKKIIMKDVILYMSKRAELTFSRLALNRVKISLYDVVKTTGELKDVFRFTYNGRRYDRLSLSEKIRAGAEVSELVKRLTGRNYPVFFDNMESVDDLSNIRPTSQMILAKCVRNAELSVRAGSTAMPKAA